MCHICFLFIQVKFIIDESTTLADLLALNLYKYEEEVKTIVDKSVKEQSMEKILTELKNTWGTMEFFYEMNDRTNCWLLKCSEDTIEILEEHQVSLSFFYILIYAITISDSISVIP